MFLSNEQNICYPSYVHLKEVHLNRGTVPKILIEELRKMVLKNYSQKSKMEKFCLKEVSEEMFEWLENDPDFLDCGKTSYES